MQEVLYVRIHREEKSFCPWPVNVLCLYMTRFSYIPKASEVVWCNMKILQFRLLTDSQLHFYYFVYNGSTNSHTRPYFFAVSFLTPLVHCLALVSGMLANVRPAENFGVLTCIVLASGTPLIATGSVGSKTSLFLQPGTQNKIHGTHQNPSRSLNQSHPL